METQLTAPQQKVLDYVTKHGEVEVGLLNKRGLDVRAANNLVKSGVLSLMGGVYRLKGKKPAAANDGQAVSKAAEKPAEQAARKDETAAPERPSEAPAQAEAAPVASAPAEPTETAPEATTTASEATTALAVGSPVRVLTGKYAGRVGTIGKISTKTIEPKYAFVKLTRRPREQKDKTAFAKLADLEPVDAAALAAFVEAAKPARAARPAKPAINPSEKCLCGCGAELGPKRRFALGHDAKLHSLVLRVSRGQAEKKDLPTAEVTLDYLRGAPWMKDEIRKAIGL